MIIVTGTIVKDSEAFEYEISKFVGQGSFGNVYQAKRKSDNTIWAVKTLQASFVDDTILAAFINEGKLAAQIQHENVIKYVFFHDGTVYDDLPPYIIMEFADGGTLDQIIKSRAVDRNYLSNEEIRSLMSQLIDGMEAINSFMIHRDIKPDNILLHANKIKMSDFGLTKIVTESTRTTTFKGIGCLPYMAPEAWIYDKNTILMDIYSMGVVFYELSALRHPLSVANNDIKLWQDAHMFQSPPRPDTVNTDLSLVITQTIMKMIEKQPRARFQTWMQIRNFLENDTQASDKHSTLVDMIIRRKMQDDEEQRTLQSQMNKRKQEIEDLRKIVQYQFRNEVVLPISDFLDQVNGKYVGTKNLITHRDLNATIVTSAQNRISIEMRLIQADDFGMRKNQVELRPPMARDRRIVAWGHLTGPDRKGFNLLLLSSEDTPYGLWQLLVNSNNPLGKSQRPSPFPFSFDEIEEELKYVGMMHIYQTEQKGLEIDYICKFISEYI